eukprot:CAMPEP_0183335258 /NCGR_PEP_ID=MMETSP0164_2-20130417/3618_1 /TAXON_ID=221442 /ORGANISM="Coccolithus pelagicus ssp braarudi, Strain PLY182g" /LENGTH=192 /DNA_ID=CAMNT_0025504595 /DNA_START=37 /DNA_END=615 /DNA_ORIENTATION=+
MTASVSTAVPEPVPTVDSPLPKEVVASSPAEGEKSKGEEEEYRYGWETTDEKGMNRFGGVFKPKATMKRQLSALPDEMALWRLEARSKLLIEMFDEATEAIEARPEPHENRTIATQGIDLNVVVDQACHRQCDAPWKSYQTCMERLEEHKACNGWYRTYVNCLDTKAPNLVLKVLQAVSEDDPDPNVQRLRK